MPGLEITKAKTGLSIDSLAVQNVGIPRVYHPFPKLLGGVVYIHPVYRHGRHNQDRPAPFGRFVWMLRALRPILPAQSTKFAAPVLWDRRPQSYGPSVRQLQPLLQPRGDYTAASHSPPLKRGQLQQPNGLL